jgi:phage baseplate assembly protein W
MHLAYPFRIDGRGRSAETSDEDHVREMIEQVLFTSPGERVNRPDFGTGLRQLVFGPNSAEIAAALEFTVQGALQKWLGDVLKVEGVEVESVDSELRVTVRYVVLESQERRLDEFVREV